MSWLVNSIANSLNLDAENDNHHPQTTTFAAAASTAGENRPPGVPIEDDHQIASSSPYDEIAAARGVKEDLSELSDTLSRQFWGVASFLAPPPQISDRDRDRQSDDSDVDYADEGVESAAIRDELPEFGGNFEAEVSNVEQYGSEKELSVEYYARRGVVGVTEEVVAFARNIALHPETWIDFPLPDDDIEDDYELSDAQQEHAMAVERLAPELAALRIELCLSYMSESCFWKIYFALVHPRLSRHDAEILSTPEMHKTITESLATTTIGCHSKPKPYESSNASADNTLLSHEEYFSVPVVDQFESIPSEISPGGPASSAEADFEVEKHAVVSTEIAVIDKRVVEEVPMKETNIPKPSTIISKIINQQYEEDDADDWLEEVNSEADVLKGTYPPGDYDDISFSDLEDDEDVPSSFKKVGNPNHKVSSNYLKNKESNGWLDIKEY
ncbi:hypothetical protein Cgig2_009549 [Carnegiea gigantea]|uniref:BSD domain-containing protein n=1 Tax=Carnegiea gigantea TaxID=171969 RepID=A0A9Q1QGL5_9CARY|nr:hypothetical protein Cgig2_009549 [Carnegiea gigantea]